MKLATATMALLAQTALCSTVLQAREAKVTAAAVLLDRRAQKDQCSEGKTACGDGNGCCPRGSRCTQSKGVGMCADACEGATLFCDFGKGVKLCCQPGASCDYSQSLCTQHNTDSGGVWTSSLTSTPSGGTPLPTAPVFSSTSDGGASSSTESATTESSSAAGTQTSQSGPGATSSSASARDGSGTSGAGATATKTPKGSGSAIVVSWSAGVLAVVFGIMAAL
ncbi:hypothetical protein ISF_01612 [Cordyceps fumosorosea ARSEF 2679]|uniref:GPI anchored serine-threonine rich protein n=1 Tax=Cordyceps fumosorosea (strain ARSEF 2679) TaxID=1081104 RepID=A0A162MY75_CORFA|nr:hypothetical protein ISF_01612 [Cordyceps fumosorosea ARSEF 2679]OAA72539.1 hypothetical protein ISF_01612 [Cordyceps fumosorosea ARSEF 2679]